MDTPEDEDRYVLLQASDRVGPLSIYVARQILEKMAPRAEELYFVMDLGRRYKLHLGRPARALLRRGYRT